MRRLARLLLDVATRLKNRQKSFLKEKKEKNHGNIAKTGMSVHGHVSFSLEAKEIDLIRISSIKTNLICRVTVRGNVMAFSTVTSLSRSHLMVYFSHFLPVISLVLLNSPSVICCQLNVWSQERSDSFCCTHAAHPPS